MLGFFNVPILRRVAFHAKRIGSQIDRHFFTTLLTAVLGFVAVATLLVALFGRVVLGERFGPGFLLGAVIALGGASVLLGVDFATGADPVRGDLLARLGRNDEAAAEFRRAAALTRNERERVLLEARASACARAGAP